jgi:hypothetical protein
VRHHCRDSRHLWPFIPISRYLDCGNAENTLYAQLISAQWHRRPSSSCGRFGPKSGRRGSRRGRGLSEDAVHDSRRPDLPMIEP